MWTSSKVRLTFLDFFKDRQHTVVESSSLVPINDPTLLFTNAGMNQFKDLFLGIDKKNYVRATTSQKCVRAGGKHNDLDTVGRTPRHHTFFEMLGNFSFGDYFKEDAIKYAWQFLTEVVELPKKDLWITIYKDDDDAYNIWTEVTDVEPKRILRLGEKDNFWSMGDTGPCGPCSEILYDRGEKYSCGIEGCSIGVCDCDRWLEIWNLVFMQFNRDESGNMTPLPRPSIDTGMGLERLCSVLQQKESNYDTDLFTPIINKIEDRTGIKYNPSEEGFPFRVIADHSRACTFLIADGVLPSNDGRGYVLRRILRRAVRFGRFLGVKEPFLYENVQVVSDLMQEAYPEINEKKDFIKDVIKLEEERFFVTLNEGIKKVDEIIANSKKTNKIVITGEEAFMLYDTYGFPLDLTEDIAEENGFTVDTEGFNKMMEDQRNRARMANKSENAFVENQIISEILESYEPTIFTGYDNISDESIVLALISSNEKITTAKDIELSIVVSKTPFYAESGGQIADTGIIKGAKGKFAVKTVQKVGRFVVHHGVLNGEISEGEKVELFIDSNMRLDIARNHTATHLLHKVLRDVLGEHAQQKGSLVEPDRLRFDFSHLQSLSVEELEKIEIKVNDYIWNTSDVKAVNTDLNSAREMGAIALFGEKYGDEVRVVNVADSIELCGGTHVLNTGQIGLFKILSEGSIGSGLRRIEAVTGKYAFNYLKQSDNKLKEVAVYLRTTPAEAINRIEVLNKQLKEKDKELENFKAKASKDASQNLIEKAIEINGIKTLISDVNSEDANILRQNAEMLRDKLGNSVVVLGSVIEDKVSLVCFASKDAVEKGIHAGKIIGGAAKVAAGGGGGRPDMAQAGGKDITKLNEALATAKELVEKTLY